MRVLYVDDDRALTELVGAVLTGLGMQATTLNDPRVARARLLEERFDVLLIDLVMPGLDGLEVLQGIREEQSLRHLPVVLVSSREDPLTPEQARGLNVRAYLRKPYQLEALVPSLQAAIQTATQKFSRKDLNR